MMNDRVLSRRGHALGVSSGSSVGASRRRMRLPWVIGLIAVVLATLMLGVCVSAPTAQA